MLRRTLVVAVASLLTITMMAVGSAAQEATPDGDCPTTTVDENREIVQQYLDAVVAGDAETADALLADDFHHDLSSDLIEVPNEDGNADELENIDTAGEVTHEIVTVIADGEWVAIEWHYDLTGEHLSDFEGVDLSAIGTVDVMTFVRIECGEIAEANFASNTLNALLAHGFEIHPPGADEEE